MANDKDQETPLTTDDIANMTTQEVLDELLFKSYFTTDQGPSCRCGTCKCNHLLGYIPDKLCETDLDSLDDVSIIPDFEGKVSSLCPCQRSHFFDLSVKDGTFTYTPTEGKLQDSRRIRLPNF